MRPIKFRAWNMPDKVMVDLKKLTPLALDPEINMDGLFIPFDEKYVLMQFTGLLDRNGKEIYEGDILRGKRYDKDGVGVVRWEDSGFWMDGDENFYAYDEEGFPNEGSEVIGNIYENPELVK